MTISTEFQTPPAVAEYMASLVPDQVGYILEPTPGVGNLVAAISAKGDVVAPDGDFWQFHHPVPYDYVVMNPPFTPMAEGFRYLKACMSLCDNIVALLPWFILINSERRVNDIKAFGLVSVTHLPRKTFPGSRIQCCVLEMKKGFSGDTAFRTFSF